MGMGEAQILCQTCAAIPCDVVDRQKNPQYLAEVAHWVFVLVILVVHAEWVEQNLQMVAHIALS